MTTALVLQTTPWRDAATDAALRVVAREVAPVLVVAATTDPERTTRLTGLPSVPATRAAVLRALPRVDDLVVLGGHPFHGGSLHALATAFRTAGKRVALVGVGADGLSGRTARAARQTVTGSALTVLDSDASATELLAAGVPAPVRVGADPAWLDLQDPPAWRGDGPAWVVVGHGDQPPLALLVAAARAVERPGGLVVQARRGGAVAGADLDSAHDLVAALAGQGVAARVAAPAATLDDHRLQLAGAAVVLCGDAATVMAAAAAGVPLVAWPGDRTGTDLAARLGFPVSSADGDASLDAARAAAERVQAAVRHEVATAGEVTDLLRLLLTEGTEPVPARPGSVPDQHALRPTGVMR